MATRPSNSAEKDPALQYHPLFNPAFEEGGVAVEPSTGTDSSLYEEPLRDRSLVVLSRPPRSLFQGPPEEDDQELPVQQTRFAASLIRRMQELEEAQPTLPLPTPAMPRPGTVVHAASSSGFVADKEEEEVKVQAAPSTPPRVPRVFVDGSPLKRTVCDDRVLHVAKKALRASDPHTSVNPPPDGSSGFTLMCKTPAVQVLPEDEFLKYGFDQEALVHFVLKWVVEREADNERVCTQLCEAFGLHAPTIRPVQGKAAELFVSPMKKAKAAFSPDPFELLIMDRLRGCNLFDLCKTQRIFDLDITAWQVILNTLGRAAIFDLFIGNFDRVVRFDRAEDGYALKQHGSANLGNVLVHMTPEKGKNVSKVSMIDTTSIVPGHAPTASHEVQASFDLMGFFDEEGADEVEDGYVTPPNGLSTVPESASEPVAPQMHRLFVALAAATQRGDEVLTRHIMSCVERSLLEALDDLHDIGRDDPRLMAMLEKIQAAAGAVRAGVHDGLEHLKSEAFCHGAVKIASEGSVELQNLIRMNVEWLASQAE